MTMTVSMERGALMTRDAYLAFLELKSLVEKATEKMHEAERKARWPGTCERMPDDIVGVALVVKRFLREAFLRYRPTDRRSIPQAWSAGASRVGSVRLQIASIRHPKRLLL
jgi:hypothetical protein